MPDPETAVITPSRRIPKPDPSATPLNTDVGIELSQVDVTHALDLKMAQFPARSKEAAASLAHEAITSHSPVVENPFPRFGTNADPALVKRIEMLEKILPVSALSSLAGLSTFALADKGMSLVQGALGVDLSMLVGPIENTGLLLFVSAAVTVLATMSTCDRLEERILDKARK